MSFICTSYRKWQKKYLPNEKMEKGPKQKKTPKQTKVDLQYKLNRNKIIIIAVTEIH